MSRPSPRVVYIYDENLAKCLDKIGNILNRAAMVHELIKSYHITSDMECVQHQPATKQELLQFHSEDYLDFLFQQVDVDTTDTEFADEDEDTTNDFFKVSNTCPISTIIRDEDKFKEYGLGYDCPVFNGLEKFALNVAGGTITAAKYLNEGANVAINWSGGWHHAQRSEASGFCYVNDIVLGIHELQRKHKYILYIDLDAHHGDGVENAFAYSDKVMTLSIHHYESGYFPGTGNSNDVGNGRGKYCTLNLPLKSGVSDAQYLHLFNSIFGKTIDSFQPEAVVVQCGADCLSKDPLGAFNLTSHSIVGCVGNILDANLPTLLLGGGGYNISNAARLWTTITAHVVHKKLSNDIPHDNVHFLSYGPNFELTIEPSMRKNENDEQSIIDLISSTSDKLKMLRKRKFNAN